MRRITSALIAVFTIAATVALASSPAHANASIEATSVALYSGANCTSSASLDIGLTAFDTNYEVLGQSSNLSGIITDFEQPEDWSGFDGVYENWGVPIGVDQPEGSVLAGYGRIGQVPPTAADTAEWFVLYRCSDTPGQNLVLFECFGDYGTCPQTAAEAAELLFAAEVDDTTPDPGQPLVVSGTCLYPLAGAVLRQDGLPLDAEVVEPDPDGAFAMVLIVPPGTAPGTVLEVTVDCGFDGETVLSTTIDLVVAGVTPTTVAPTPTTVPAAVVTPTFTG